jgi:hypothetical protein
MTPFLMFSTSEPGLKHHERSFDLGLNRQIIIGKILSSSNAETLHRLLHEVTSGGCGIEKNGLEGGLGG